MKTKIAKKQKSKPESHAFAVLVKAESAEKLFEAARTQWRLFKIEHKQARKAFKEAKKAAKIARKEARAATKDLKRKGIKITRPLRAATALKTQSIRVQKTPGGSKHNAKRNGGALAVTAMPGNAPAEPAAVELQA
jgi:hypothetical protein